MTRREFIAGATSFVGGVSAFGKPIRSNIGGRMYPNAEPSIPSASLYVQDGLVAMWDGIENIGRGEHEDMPTTWTELVSGYTQNIGATISYIGTGYANAGGLDKVFRTPFWVADLGIVHIEAVGSGDYCYVGGNVNKANSSSDDIIGVAVGNGGVWTGKIAKRRYGTGDIGLASDAIHSISTSHTTSGNVWVDGRAYLKTTNSATYFNAGGYLSVFGTGYTAYNNLPCTVYCVRLYSRILTAEEIAHNYTIDQARFGI